MATQKEFDVGISFLSADSALATALAAALVPLKVFVYPNRQEEIAGTNGVETFRDAFRNKVQVPVVLFRPRWGQTPYTRVEEIAITEYCTYEAGWNVLMFVTLEDGAIPKWVPNIHMRFDLNAFPVEQLVGAIKSRVVAAGGVVRPPSAAELAKQMAAREAFDKETRRLLEQSNQPFLEATNALFQELERQIVEVCQATGWTVPHGFDQSRFVAWFGPVSLKLTTHEVWGNTARDGALHLRHFHGRILTPAEIAQGYSMYPESQEFGADTLAIRRDPNVGWMWEFRGSTAPPDETARLILTNCLQFRAEQLKR